MNTGILDPGVGQPATRRVTYAYDAYNRLVTRTLDADGDGPVAASVSNYLHDGNQIVLEFDGSQAADLAHRYLWGPAVDQILADEQVTSPGTPGTVLWPLVDNPGTVRDLAQYDSQTDATTVANHRGYDAFGELQSETNPAVDHLFAYTARLFDDATGLQWNLNRWYDPAVGRWLSRDPIGFEAGDANLYRYVGNRALNGTDPTGLVATSDSADPNNAAEQYNSPRGHLKPWKGDPADGMDHRPDPRQDQFTEDDSAMKRAIKALSDWYKKFVDAVTGNPAEIPVKALEGVPDLQDAGKAVDDTTKARKQLEDWTQQHPYDRPKDAPVGGGWKDRPKRAAS